MDRANVWGNRTVRASRSGRILGVHPHLSSCIYGLQNPSAELTFYWNALLSICPVVEDDYYDDGKNVPVRFFHVIKMHLPMVNGGFDST